MRILIVLLAFTGVMTFSISVKSLPSTTDYLVRLEALAYLDTLHEAKELLKSQMAMGTKDSDENLQKEIDNWNQQISQANQVLEEIYQETRDTVELLRTFKEGEAQFAKGEIERLEVDIQNIGTNLKDWAIDMAVVWWKGLTEEQKLKRKMDQISKINMEIATWKVLLNKLEADLKEPARLNEEAEAQYMEQKAEWERKKTHAMNSLAQLEARSENMKKNSFLERSKGTQASFESQATCMIKLSACSDVKAWDSYNPQKSEGCKKEYLKKAKQKATNNKCAVVNTDSPWDKIEECIPEYRSQILKKPGTEGLHKEFLNCMSKS